MFLDWRASSAGFKENYEHWVGKDWKGGSTYKISTKKEKKEKQLVSLSVTVSNKGNRQVLASLAGYVHIEFFPFFFPLAWFCCVFTQFLTVDWPPVQQTNILIGF